MESVVPVYAATPRKGVVIALSVLALLFLGPLAGVPAWIIANEDIRDLRNGFIHPALLPSLLSVRRFAIAGTFLSPIWLFVEAIVLFVVVTVLAALLFAGPFTIS